MPVCRKPTVVSALTTVSPESSSTIRSTPCVLGCCGPMLTVIVSWRSSVVVVAMSGREKLALRPFHQRADRVNYRAVHFLNAGGRGVGDVDMNRRPLSDHPAVSSGQRNRLHRPGVG